MRKIPLIYKVLLFLTGLGACVGIGYYILSDYPEYTILQINKSIERHNWNSFKKFVDVDNILNSSFEAFAEIQQRKDSTDHSGKTGYQSMFSKDLYSFVRPQAVKILTQELNYFVTHGEFENYARVKMSETTIAAYRKAFNEYTNYSGFSKEVISDSLALFHFNFKLKSGENLVVKAHLSRTKHLWRMTEITNLKEILVKLDEIKATYPQK